MEVTYWILLIFFGLFAGECVVIHFTRPMRTVEVWWMAFCLIITAISAGKLFG